MYCEADLQNEQRVSTIVLTISPFSSALDLIARGSRSGDRPPARLMLSVLEHTLSCLNLAVGAIFLVCCVLCVYQVLQEAVFGQADAVELEIQRCRQQIKTYIFGNSASGIETEYVLHTIQFSLFQYTFSFVDTLVYPTLESPLV